MPANAAIYLPVSDPDLRKVFASARSDKGLLRKATHFEVELSGTRVRFNLMPRERIAPHLQGFRGYVASLPASPEAKAAATERIARTQSVLALVTDAEFADNAAIGQALLAIAGAFDGIVFVHDSVVLPDGNALVGPMAAAPATSTAIDQDDGGGDEQAPPPSPRRVAERALVLCAVTCRAFIEEDRDNPAAEDFRAMLLPWLHRLGITAELEEHEAAMLAVPVGGLDPRTQIEASWLSEGLGVLAWALGRHDLPAYDASVDPGAVAASLGFRGETLALELEPAAVALLESPRLRPATELAAYRESVFAVHWRLRQFMHIKREAIDFAELARTAWFGPLSLEGARLVDKDLAIGDVAIAQAPPDRLGFCASITVERHRAANWLLGGAHVYSEVDTST